MSSATKRSMAHYVQAEHIRTRERLGTQEHFPIPAKGDIIVYSEIQKYHDKHDYAPQRGVGTVIAQIGCNICISRMAKNGYFFETSVREVDFRLGIFRFIRLRALPGTYQTNIDMNLYDLSDELAELAYKEDLAGFSRDASKKA